MTKKQFKEFVQLQNKWYEKLKKSGFQDIEWYDPSSGLGQGSPFLKSNDIPDSGVLRKAYSSELQNHYRLCRNFRENGPFYPNLKRLYRDSAHLKAEFRSFKAFTASLEDYYTKVDYELWNAYTEGSTIRQISALLRRLYRTKAIGATPKSWHGNTDKRHTWGKSATGEPYSIFWVKHRLDYLKLANIKFNHLDPEGIDVWTDDEDDEDFDISDNRGSI